MKINSTILSILSAVIVCMASISCSAKNVVIKVQDLPQQAQSFLDTHFKTSEISLVVKDGNEYDIRFENGWEVEFNHKGQWEKIDCKRDSVPSSVISILPEAIPSYLRSNYENAFITEIGLDHSGYDVELSNGLDIEFSSNGRFKIIDD